MANGMKALKRLALLFAAIVFLSSSPEYRDFSAQDTSPVQIILTSDAHYGTSRTFQGAKNVDAHIVNAAMIARMNSLPNVSLPQDGGIKSGQKIGYVDYIFQTGDITNRMETSISAQPAAKSWAQFKTDYVDGITLKNKNNRKAELLAVPGNHDVSNALGYYTKMSPLTDASTLTGLYNLMLEPRVPRTTSTFNYANDRVNYSRDIAGVHFCFLQMWPDSVVRIWLNKDLKNVPATTPVVLVAHDPPAAVNTHFTNPNGTHSINETDKFINVVDEKFKSGKTIASAPIIEQRAFSTFLKQHPNIKAYLHGHIHESKFYTYTGADKDVQINAVSSDSPMKGATSGADESRVTFNFAILDPGTMTLTVRECLWNPEPSNPAAEVKWGKSVIIHLK
jgi:predicted MPP superfamily phosphohydrolase